jgi:hypothetical protein
MNDSEACNFGSARGATGGSMIRNFALRSFFL